MRVETRTGLIYDSEDSRCELRTMASSASFDGGILLIAIVTALDKERTKTYWGAFDHDAPDACVLRILESGGKWPTS